MRTTAVVLKAGVEIPLGSCDFIAEGFDKLAVAFLEQSIQTAILIFLGLSLIEHGTYF